MEPLAQNIRPKVGVRYARSQYATEFAMEPGDFILLVTDGPFEWSIDRGVNFGLERLRDAIKSSAKASAEDIIQALRDAVQKFAGSAPQLDDISIVVIRRKQEASMRPQSST